MTAGTRLRRERAEAVRAALARYPDDRPTSAAIELLYEAQALYGHLTADAIDEVAEIVGADPSHVRGLVGFYTLLRGGPHGGYIIHFCTDLPCALRGAEDLLPTLCEKLGVVPGGTSADGLFTLETVMCLAACDRAPVMQVNLATFTDLDEAALDAIIADLRRRAAEGAGSRPPFGLGPPVDEAVAETEPDRA